MTPSLNPQQKKAAEASPDKPLLIVAGAGTGKTRTLVSRIIFLLQNGVQPGKICALTFTNKAAREMKERVAAAYPLAKGDGAPYLGTFHSLGARILRAEAKHLGRTSSFVIFDDHDSLQLVKKIVKGLQPEPEEGAAWFSEQISGLKNGMLRAEELRAGRRIHQQALDVAREYEAALARNNAFDFDDLVQKVVLLWRKSPATLQKYRRRFSHVLVDEYQDLNNVQYEFIRLLVGEDARLSVVGDDQQTIYSWRGSNFEIFLNFERDWPQSQVVLLEENYRSTQNIIRAAGEVIKNNSRQKPKTLWTQNEEGARIKILEAYDEDEEADWIGEKIESEPNGSTAILYRTNAQSRALEQALLSRGIPYLVFGGVKFYERKEVKDVLSGLRYILNPEDEVASDRLEKLLHKRRFADFALKIKGKSAEPPLNLINFFLRETDYFNYVVRGLTKPLERQENIGELLHFASQFSDLPDFLEQIALLQATDVLAAETKRAPVNLMTMHLAKGLEFDRVFVAGASDGLLPHARSVTPAEMEEERRLLYVAMTRAKKELFISFYDDPSRFLGEIPEELVEFETLLQKKDDPLLTDGEGLIDWN